MVVDTVDASSLAKEDNTANMTVDITVQEGDCLLLTRALPPASVDLVICDPPYGCTKNQWDVPVDLVLLFREIERVTKENAAVVFFAQGMLTAQLMTGPWKKHWRYNLVWAKNKVRGATVSRFGHTKTSLCFTGNLQCTILK